MKRRIKEAFGGIHLSEASKERIWEDIMDSQKSDYRTVLKHSKFKNWSAVPAALMLVALIAIGGFWGIRALGNHDTPSVATKPSGNISTVPIDSSDPIDYEQEYADVPEYLRDIVIMYAKAIYEDWPQEDWERIGFSTELYQVKDYVECGFVLKDLDGDGLQDLLLYGGSQLHQIIISNLWEEHIELGLPAYTEHILTPDQYGVQGLMTLCEDKVIMLTYVLNDSDYYVTYNRIGEDEYGLCELEMIEKVYAIGGSEWFAGTNLEEAVPVTADEAENIKAGYKPEKVQPRLFIRKKGYVVNYQHQFDGVDERYLPLLMNYGKALCEDWKQVRWLEAGLSLEVYRARDKYLTFEYTLVDMDGNGVEELLIFGDDQLYALYTLRDDQPDERLTWTMHHNAERLSIQLCEDNVIKVVQKDSTGATDTSFYRVGKDGLGDITLVMVNNVLQTADGQWYAGPNATDAVLVTEKEAQTVIAGYVELDMDTKPMLNVVRIE